MKTATRLWGWGIRGQSALLSDIFCVETNVLQSASRRVFRHPTFKLAVVVDKFIIPIKILPGSKAELHAQPT